jgi:hypothetical protein
MEQTQIDPLLPTPDNWKQILSYPPHIKTLWIKSFVKELKELIKKETVTHETPNKDDPFIPVTVKYRVKITSEGLVEKLKTPIALRGDMMKETMFTPDTWCPIAGFRALMMFLAFAAECQQRVYTMSRPSFRQMLSGESSRSSPNSGKIYFVIILTYIVGLEYLSASRSHCTEIVLPTLRGMRHNRNG